jgi:hypothetical protein
VSGSVLHFFVQAATLRAHRLRALGSEPTTLKLLPRLGSGALRLASALEQAGCGGAARSEAVCQAHHLFCLSSRRCLRGPRTAAAVSKTTTARKNWPGNGRESSDGRVAMRYSRQRLLGTTGQGMARNLETAGCQAMRSSIRRRRPSRIS